MPALDDFAGNPLLLRMMAEVHAAGGTLGERRAELYDEMMKLTLGRRRQSKDLPLDLGIEQKLAVAQPLALAMLQQGSPVLPAADAVQFIRGPLARVKREMRPEDFLDSLEHDAGILVAREADMLAFAHLTYQEYLAARQLGPKGAEKLIPRLAEPAWRETILFWSALHDASPLVAALLHELQESLLLESTPTARDLELALRVEKEAKELKPELQDKLRDVVESGRESRDAGLRTTVATALLARRLASLRPIDEAMAIDDDLITNAEYQLFLDESRAEGAWRQPDHWVEPVFPPGSGHSPVAGVRPSDAEAFCAWLTQRQGGAVRFRLPTFGETTRHPLPRGPEARRVAYWLFESSDLGDVPAAGLGQVAEQLAQMLPRYIRTPLPSNLLGHLDLFTIGHTAFVASDFVRKRYNDPALALPVARDLARDLARAFDPALAGDLVRALDLDRDPALALTLTLALARDLALARAHTPDRDLDPALALTRALARTRVSVRALPLDHILDPALALARARTLARDLARDPDPDRALDLALDPAFVLKSFRKSLQKASGDSALRLINYVFLAFVFGMLSRVAASDYVAREYQTSLFSSFVQWIRFRQMNIRTRQQQVFMNDAANRLGYACAACILIHHRIMGAAEPYEGIRIVRERVTEEADNTR